MFDPRDVKYWIGCVDDDRPFLDSAGRLIARAVEEHPFDIPCEVEVASGAAEFGEIAKEMTGEGSELALLITDQMMPECTGLELIESIKQDHPATSCVLLTGYAGLESARYAINNRLLDRYVCKPIEDMKRFSEMVASELERFHLRRVEAIQEMEIKRQAEELRLANARLSRMKTVAECVAYFSRELRTLDLDEVLDLACDKVPALFGAKACFLFVPDRNNRLALWRQRHVNCLAPVPPSADINKVMRRALSTRQPAVSLHRDWCSGSADEECDAHGCVVMPLKLSAQDPAFARDEDAPLPALLCMCGIDDPDHLSNEDLEYKVLLVNDILGANIANALAHIETERLASEDSLTGAKTRRVFDDLLRREWERYRRYRSPFCIALLDVDHMKRINDTHGHAAGDEVLRRIAEIAHGRSRECDTLARFGGDEFCLLLPETSLAGARSVMERVKDVIDGTRFALTNTTASVSIGISCAIGKGTPEDVLGSADRALYEAKRAGRGRLCVEEG